MKIKLTLLFLVLTLLSTSMAFSENARFTDTEPAGGEHIIMDAITGLIWQKSYASDKTWQLALAYCEELDFANQTDWRLPSKNELASLVNYGTYSAASDFPDMPSEYFWSSSSYVGNTDSAWSVNFGNGQLNDRGKTDDYQVRCVRAGR